MPQTDPINPASYNNQVARASAVLPAAGAYDTTPTTLPCPGFSWLTLFFRYTRGGASGAFAFKIEGQLAGDTDWYQTTRYSGGTVTTGANVSSDAQREEVEIGAAGAGEELYHYGPIRLERGLDQLRVNAKETGNTGAPGTLEIKAVFS